MSVSFQQEPNDFLVSGPHCDMQGSPTVATGELDVGSVTDEQFDKLEIAGATAVVKCRLSVGREDVDVDKLRGAVDGAAA